MELIDKLTTMGVFYKIEKLAKYPHIYVAPTFYSLSIDEKQTFISVVYAYHLAEDPAADMAVLYDSRSGKKIGTYSRRGLDLD